MPRMRDAIRSGMERLEVLRLLADADELDRLSGRRDDRERRAAARVAVRLRQDDAGQRKHGGETRRRAHGVLPGHRVGDEEDLAAASVASTTARTSRMRSSSMWRRPGGVDR